MTRERGVGNVCWGARWAGPRGRSAGLLLVISLIALVLLAGVSLWLLRLASDESAIADNSADGLEAIYLAESGVREAIAKCQLEEPYCSQFKNKSDTITWTNSFTRSTGLGPNRSYSVDVSINEKGSAFIASTGVVRHEHGRTRRTVTVHYVDQTATALASKIRAAAAYGKRQGIDKKGHRRGGKIDLRGKVSITGDMLANKEVRIHKEAKDSTVNTTNPVTGKKLPYPQDITGMAGEKVKAPAANSRFNVNGKAVNGEMAGTAAYEAMPGVDFNWYKANATTVYTEKQWRDLFKIKGTTIKLSGIVYVLGKAHIPDGFGFELAGVLVADRDINIHNSKDVKITKSGAGVSKEMGGLIAKHDVKIDTKSGITSAVYGLVYANHKVSLKGQLTITGAVMAQDEIQFRGKAKDTINLTKDAAMDVAYMLTRTVPGSTVSTRGIVDWAY